jgi:hypothetical protein
MGCFDAALLALRAPGMSLMLDSPQTLEYLVFGLALVALALARVPPVAPAGSAPAVRGRHILSGPREPAGPVPIRPSLRVVVAPHCFGCARARALAAEAAARFPGLDVRVVDLDASDAQVPAGIVAIPAYVLDGRLLFTGNPTPAALFAALGQDTEMGG